MIIDTAGAPVIARDGGARLGQAAGRFSRRQVLAAGAGGALFAVGARFGAAAEGTPAAMAGQVVETIHGPVTAPAQPERIVAINFPSVLALLELGVMPVGITSYLPALPPGYPDVSGIALIDNDAGELDLETIIALEPDLLVGSDWADRSQQFLPYDELSRIAPTALFEWQSAAGNWEAEAAGVAEAIGKSAELAQLRDDYEQHAERIRTTYAGAPQAATWDLISASDSNWYLYGPTSSHGKVAIAAGVALGAAAEQTEGYTENSFERFDLLAQTGALLVRSAGDEGLQVLANVGTYQSLPSVRANHVFTSDYFFPSSYGLSQALLGDIEAGLQAL
jgi:iron complex transport system substrate-binding protein